MAAKFLCCLPLRLGVLIISFIQFFFAGAIAGLLWFSVWYSKEHENSWATLAETMRTTTIITGVIYTVVALIAFLGFMGAICRKNGFVKSYYVLLCAALGFQLGSSIWFIVNFLRSRNRSYNDCILGSTEPNRIGYCQSIENFKKMHPAGMVAVIGIPVLLQLYACYIVYHYAQRLQDQKLAKTRESFTKSAYQPLHNEHDYPMAPTYNPQPTGYYGYNPEAPQKA